ncbi:MAG: hypothetical protein HQM13_20420 [SAR324 cluster bacterium]|nr:hypothetical protein [SAR324 cluster bacterium]
MMSPKTSDVAAAGNASRGNELTNTASQFSKTMPEESSIEKPRELPLIVKDDPASEEEMQTFWSLVRQFFRTGEEGGIGKLYHQPDVYPALLAPYRDMSKIRYDYPLWIADPNEPLEESSFQSLSELLAESMESAAPEPNQSKELKDNLPRLEKIIRSQLSSSGSRHPFRESIETAVEELRKQLSLPGSEEEALLSSCSALLAKLPDGGALIQFTEETPFHCLAAILNANHLKKYESFKKEIGDLLAQLRDLLRVEEGKSAQARGAEHLEGTLGFGTSFVDPGALSGLLPESSSEAMPLERFNRIKIAYSNLEKFEPIFGDDDAIVLVPEDWEGSADFSWNNVFPNSTIVSFAKGDGCSKALLHFEEHMRAISEWFSALRIARLEVKDQYHPEIHDHFFAYFDWKSFSKEEIALAPPLLLIDDERSLLESGLSDLSRLLLSKKPIKMMIVKRPLLTEEKTANEKQSRLDPRPELGHLAVSHRNGMVVQSSVGTPQHLMKGFIDGIQGFFPAFFYVLSPQEKHSLSNPYIWSGAALESREFPVFTYDPQKGEQWGSRFDIAANPLPSLDWPVYELNILDEKEKESSLPLAFTFADFAALDALYSDQFFLIPSSYWNDELIPIPEYLKLSSEESYAKVPFIWMVDEKNQLQKVMMSYSMVLACQERLDYWRVIQDLGGSNNYHAERAAQKAREEAQTELSSQIAALQQEQQSELERVRRETAGEAMEKLSSLLLDLDSLPMSPLSGSTASVKSPPRQEAAPPPEELDSPQETPAAKTAEPEPEEELSFDEPWIEGFRCTTCNECTDLNSAMFEYNADKQAIIKDASAGTFKQLVTAAEKCPAKCIHPGKPLNPDEPDLDELIKRAEPFN